MKYILYHSSCYDGFGAAYAAWKALGDVETKYIPVSYGYSPPEMTNATQIYIVDFSYSPDILLALAKICSVTIIDHHITAKEALTSLPSSPHLQTIFDMNKSGALLTWEYFHKEPAPPLIQHISDRDLWTFKLDGTAKIHKALVSLPMDFMVWDALDVEQLKIDGEIAERLYVQLVDNIVKHAWIIKLDGHDVPVVNTSIAWSEVGQELLLRFPKAPFVASFTVFEDQVMWSLRSKPEFDVSEVAKKFGGGGHKNAAGFKTVRY